MLRMRSKLGQKVRHFFCKREEIFIGCNSNELVDLEFLGDPKATREDFDDAVRCFETFTQEIERIRENNSDYFETKAEDNELYRFLIPVIESIRFLVIVALRISFVDFITSCFP